MIYRRSPNFRKKALGLPKHIQEKAAKAFSLFQQNPRHPSLGVKKIKGAEDIWEGRIDRFYRFTFTYYNDPKANDIVCLFLDIGPHDVVDDAAR